MTCRKCNSLEPHRCTVPLGCFLAVFFTATTIRIAKCELLLCINITEPCCNLEIRLKRQPKTSSSSARCYLTQNNNDKTEDSQRPSSDPFSRPILGKSTGRPRILRGRARRAPHLCRCPHERFQGRLQLPPPRGAAMKNQESRPWDNPNHAAT